MRHSQSNDPCFVRGFVEHFRTERGRRLKLFFRRSARGGVFRLKFSMAAIRASFGRGILRRKAPEFRPAIGGHRLSLAGDWDSRLGIQQAVLTS